MPPGTVEYARKARLENSQVSNGKWWVQDLAARMVAALAGDISEKSVLDLCAAPEGKQHILRLVEAM